MESPPKNQLSSRDEGYPGFRRKVNRQEFPDGISDDVDLTMSPKFPAVACVLILLWLFSLGPDSVRTTGVTELTWAAFHPSGDSKATGLTDLICN